GLAEETVARHPAGHHRGDAPPGRYAVMKRFHPGAIAAAAATVAIGLTLAGCSSPTSLSGGGGGSDSIVVGSANYPENVTLAYVYGGALAATGVKVSYKVNI